MTEPAIECRNVWKIFGLIADADFERLRREGGSKEDIQKHLKCVVAVAGASFSIAPGEIFCIMGLSGSGKSTLLRHMNGLIKPTAGDVLIGGVDIAGLNPAELRDLRARKIGMVFQNFALLPHRNVIDNVAFGLELRDVQRPERMDRARSMLKAVQLGAWEDASITELSGGMQQRVGLARALAGDPDILLMDEPFGALDPLIRRQLQDQFVGLCRNMKKTAVFITHDLDEAMRIGSRIAIMRDGRILQIGAPHEIILAPADAHVADFVQDVSSRDILSARHVMSEIDPGESKASDTALGVEVDTVLSEAARLAASEKRDIPVRDASGQIVGMLRIPDMLAVLAGRGQHAQD